jgi:uncharacterized SAM-binding protein YcdF (DUF218 family)
VTAFVGRRSRDDGGDEPDEGMSDDAGDSGEAGAPGRRFGRRRAGKHAGVDTLTDEAPAGEGGAGRMGWLARRRAAEPDGDDSDDSDDRAGSGDDGGSSRRRRPARRVVRVGFQVALGVLLAGMAYVAVTFLQVWEASRSDDVRPSDAIVVLGAAQYDCEPSPVLRSRLDHALELYTDRVAPRIVVTGGRQALDRCTEAKAGADYLRAKGVPDADIMLEVKGSNTWESIAASANFLTEDGYTRVVLVTDDYHALRVRAIADELGLEPVVSPVGDDATFRELARETGAVAVGRVVGFRRLVQIDDRLVTDPGS